MDLQFSAVRRPLITPPPAVSPKGPLEAGKIGFV